MQNEVLKFINSFYMTNTNKYDQIVDIFLNGRCYYFSLILKDRFQNYNPILMFDQVNCHFGCKIGNDVYDITGIVTDKYNWENWIKLEDELVRKRVIRDCILN